MTKQKVNLAVISVVAGLLTLSTAWAVTDEAVKQEFAKLDTNDDGMISKEEAVGHGHLAERFDSVDQNHDNSIDKAEFALFEDTDVNPKQPN